MDGKNNLTRLNLNDRMKRLTKESAETAAPEDKKTKADGYAAEEIEKGVKMASESAVHLASGVSSTAVSHIKTVTGTENDVKIHSIDDETSGSYINNSGQDSGKPAAGSNTNISGQDSGKPAAGTIRESREYNAASSTDYSGRKRENAKRTGRENYSPGTKSRGTVRNAYSNVSNGANVKPVTDASGKRINSTADMAQGRNNKPGKFRFKVKGDNIPEPGNTFHFNIKEDSMQENIKSGFRFSDTVSQDYEAPENPAGKIMEKFLKILKKLLKIIFVNLLFVMAPLIMIVIIVFALLMFILPRKCTGDSNYGQGSVGMVFDYMNGSITLEDIEKEYKVTDSVKAAAKGLYDDIETYLNDNLQEEKKADTSGIHIIWSDVIHSYLAYSEESNILQSLSEADNFKDFVTLYIVTEYEETDEGIAVTAELMNLTEISEKSGSDLNGLQAEYNMLGMYEILYEDIASGIPSYDEYIEKKANGENDDDKHGGGGSF